MKAFPRKAQKTLLFFSGNALRGFRYFDSFHGSSATSEKRGRKVSVLIPLIKFLFCCLDNRIQQQRLLLGRAVQISNRAVDEVSVHVSHPLRQFPFSLFRLRIVNDHMDLATLPGNPAHLPADPFYARSRSTFLFPLLKQVSIQVAFTVLTVTIRRKSRFIHTIERAPKYAHIPATAISHILIRSYFFGRTVP